MNIPPSLRQNYCIRETLGGIFLQNKTELRCAYQMLMNLVESLQYFHQSSSISGNITMEVTIRHHAIENMINQIENEIDH